MARPLSGDKRDALVETAIRLFAERGIGATPTSAISTAARVAEGTLFTYFATKDRLLNEVYRQLKLELAAALMSAYPKSADSRVRFRHAWDRYVEWGVSHPAKFHVLAQLQASPVITVESRAIGASGLRELERLAKDSVRRKRIRNLPLPYLAATMAACAEATVGFAVQSKNSRVNYMSAGFEIFWAGIAVR